MFPRVQSPDVVLRVTRFLGQDFQGGMTSYAEQICLPAA